MQSYNDYDRFNTINEYIWCIECGGEIEFEWNNSYYSITRTSENKISISEYNNRESEEIYLNGNDSLEYILKNGDKLRNVITKITNISRTL